MRFSIQIEDIDELRRCNGIEDIELHEEIGRFRVGDPVLPNGRRQAAIARSIG